MSAETGRNPNRRLRADAERNIAAILEAATTILARRPDASMADVARAAGVGRITLYGHFPSRDALIEAATDRILAHAGEALDALDLEAGTGRDALTRVIRKTWPILDRSRSLYAVARASTPELLRPAHDEVLGRIHALIARGQADGSLRADLPADWLVATYYSLMHAAAEEVNAGRLAPAAAADVLEATLMSAISAMSAIPAS